MASGGRDLKRHPSLESDAPEYLKEAVKFLGIRESSGGTSNPEVEQFIVDVLGKRMNAITTPWCAFWVGSVLKKAGYPHTSSGMARSYLKYGTEIELNEARQGDIVVLWRGRHDDGVTGHVGFFISQSGNKIVLLGGNQGDTVSFQTFDTRKLLKVVRPRAVTSSKTIRSAAGSVAAETVSKSTEVVLEQVKTQVEQTSGLIDTLSSFKPEIKFFFSTLSIILALMVVYYRIQDFNKGRT
jgi:uncharacterized protein (TIGR02594 family)